MNPIDKPTEHDEYNELLSVVGDIVSAGHMDQEHLARLRAHLGCRPDPAGVVREGASREPTTDQILAAVKRWHEFDVEGEVHPADRRVVAQARAVLALAAQGAVGCEPSGDALDAARYRWLRDTSVPPHNFYLSVPVEFNGVKYSREEVDVAIDAAITAARQEPK